VAVGSSACRARMGFGGADMHEYTRARPHMLCTRSPMPAPHGISACTQPSMRAAYTSSHTRQPGRSAPGFPSFYEGCPLC
jgi:hypothetical protein